MTIMNRRRVRYDVIINRAASSGQAWQVWREAEHIFKREHQDYIAHFPKGREETVLLVRSLTKADGQEKHLLVLGGDGTLNAVLEGIDCFQETCLSCIRTGSGNDFARNVHIIRRTEAALMHLFKHPSETCMDYGELYCQTRSSDHGMKKRFLISSGIGFDAEICEEVNHSRLKKVLNRFHLGKLVYVTIGIKQIFTRQSGAAMIQVDDQKPVQVPGFFLVVGMIHPCEGGGVPFCPNADAWDRRLDICLVQDMPKWKLLLAVMLIYCKQHTRLSEVTMYRGRKLMVVTKQPEWYHTDGETPFKVKKMVLRCQSGLRFVK